MAIPDSERTQILDLWREGLSASQIAGRIGGGRSRSAVLGVVHRANKNGLDMTREHTPRHTPGRAPGPRQTALRPAPKPKPIRVPQPRENEPVAIGPVGDFPDRKSCQYPRNEDGEPYQACGHPGYPWCGFHQSVVFAPQRASSGDEAANHQ